jgi:GntR family phosphonate transport system transcriptional regulator
MRYRYPLFIRMNRKPSMQRDVWQTIRDGLASDIACGKLAPGARLPTEPELCAAFRVGRHSVRRAVASLAIDGKLKVEQGRGTFVAATSLINYPIGRRTRFRQSLLEQGLCPSSEHLLADIVEAPERVASALDLAEGTPVHCVRRRGFADDVPIHIGMSFHVVALFPDLGVQRAGGRSVTEIYRDHGIEDYFRKRTTIFTRRAEADEARLLRQHADHPVMVVTKTDVTRDGRAIGYAEAVWAGDRIKFSIDSLDEPDVEPDGQKG